MRRRTPWQVVQDAFLEATVVLSYGQTGYRVRSKRWDPADTDVAMDGRVCVVTGANAGLGRAMTEALARRGATVVMGCRDVGKGDAARDAILAAGSVDGVGAGGALAVEEVDVSSLASVRDFAARVRARWPGVDVLINNAGVMLSERAESVDGHELTFATNVLGGWLLTRELTPALAAAGTGGRVIHVTSGGMYTQKLDVERLVGGGEPYDGVKAYAQTKRAQVVLNAMWAPRLAEVGVTSNAMHPGWAATPGVATSLPRFEEKLRDRLRDAEAGADTAVWLAVSPSVAERSGELFFDRRPRRAHVLPWTRESAAAREALWAACEEHSAQAQHPASR